MLKGQDRRLRDLQTILQNMDEPWQDPVHLAFFLMDVDEEVLANALEIKEKAGMEDSNE